MSSVFTITTLLRTLYQGANDVRQAAGDLEDYGNSAEETASKTETLGKAAVAIGAGLFAMKEAAEAAYAALQEGAALNQTESQLRNVADAVGTTATALKFDLRDATSGLQTDADLTQGALELVELGLAKNHDEVLRLSNVIGGLDLDMQVFGLTLANNSKARLDSLGLSLEKVSARSEELKAIYGDAVDTFDLAVVEQLEQRYALLGDQSLTTAGQISIMENTVTNLTDKMQQLFAATLAGSVQSGTALAKTVDSLTEFIDVELQLTTALNAGAISLEQYEQLLGDYQSGYADAIDVMTEAEEAIVAEKKAREEATLTLLEQHQAAEDGRAALDRLTTQSLYMAEVNDEVARSFNAIDPAIQNVIQAGRDYYDQQVELRGYIVNTGSQTLQDYAEDILGMDQAWDDTKESFEEYITRQIENEIKLAAIGPVIEEAMERVASGTQSVASAVFNVEQALKELDGTTSTVYINTVHTTTGGGGGQNVLYDASGGYVTGGTPGVDSVPALLMPGEIVIPNTAAQNFDSAVNFLAQTMGRGGNTTINVNSQEAAAILLAQMDLADSERRMQRLGV